MYNLFLGCRWKSAWWQREGREKIPSTLIQGKNGTYRVEFLKESQGVESKSGNILYPAYRTGRVADPLMMHYADIPHETERSREPI